MTLFFETSHQAACFLLTVPIGFAAALLLDMRGVGTARFLADVALCALLGATLAYLLLFLREQTLRLYHVLGMSVGAAIYLCGVSRVRKWICFKCQKIFSKMG